jgi:hypothetical protein
MPFADSIFFEIGKWFLFIYLSGLAFCTAFALLWIIYAGFEARDTSDLGQKMARATAKGGVDSFLFGLDWPMRIIRPLVQAIYNGFKLAAEYYRARNY